MKTRYLMLALLFFSTLARSEDEARRAIALADYIAGDYHAAVAVEGGQIVSEAEYAEMKDFVSLIGHYLDQIKVPSTDPLRVRLDQLRREITRKAPVTDVRSVALALKRDLIKTFSVPTHPVKIPNIELGRTVYQQTCAVCHGVSGAADTATAHQLMPPPRNFSDPNVIDPISPFQAFNTITFGIANTAMASFSMFPEETRWALASYVFSLRSGLPGTTQGRPAVSWEKALEKTNSEILSDLKSGGLSDTQALAQLSQIRNLSYPAAGSSVAAQEAMGRRSAYAGLLYSKKSMEESANAMSQGDRPKALDLAVTAYLDGFEQSEPVLKSIGKGELVAKAERLFISYRHAVQNDPSKINVLQTELVQTLDEALEVLRKTRELSPWAASVGAFFILFREGLEAVLLLGILLSMVRAGNLAISRTWLHAGWVAALAAGGVTWFGFRELITGSVREGMEGWISLVAAAVLLYVSFWLFARRDTRRWKDYLLSKLKRSTTVGALAFASAAFLAVYREAFETVLFFEALKIQAASQTFWLAIGAGVGVVVLAVVTWVILALGKRIPLHIYFGASGLFLYGLGVVFVGQGVHSLQEAANLSYTQIPFITFPALGIFPTLESLVPQAVLVSVLVGSMIWYLWIREPKEEKVLRREVADVSAELYSIHDIGEHLMEHLKELGSKLGKKEMAKQDIAEMIEHTQALDREVHQVITRLGHMQGELPKRFEAVYEEIKGLSDSPDVQELREKAEEFKEHLKTLR